MSDPTRREVLAAGAAAAPVVAMPISLSAAEGAAAIRPFTVHFPQADLDDLRQRLANTRLPEAETVADNSQGVPLALIKKIGEYWLNEYDWRKVEAKLNSYPQFITEIDGLDIHFIHVRSKHENALPLIVTHGWPGSVIEQLKIIDPLVDPTAYGGSASDAFDVVIPSMPGYGFSGKPTATGWDGPRLGRADEVRKRSAAFVKPRVILDPSDYDRWLEDDVPVEDLRALLKPYPAERMTAEAVGRKVNSGKNDDEGCIVPIGEPPLTA